MPTPGEAEWFGPAWQADFHGVLTGEVEITAPADCDAWIQVRVITSDLDLGWSEGPLSPSDLVSTRIALRLDPDPIGLAQVIVVAEFTDTDTGERLASMASAPAYVSMSDGAERWFDTAAAEAAVHVATIDGDYADENLVGQLVML